MRKFRHLAFFTLLLLTTGCLGTRHLKEGEKLLVKQQVSKTTKDIDTEDISQLYVQKTNRKVPLIPFAPYVGLYYYGLNRYDIAKYEAKKEEIQEKYNRKIARAEGKKKKVDKYERRKRRKTDKIDLNIQEGNTLMRWGEPLAVFDTSKTAATADRIEQYLQSKGYFQARVDTALRVSGRKVRVKFQVNQGPAYIIDTLMLETDDPVITSLMRANNEESLLVKGENYNQSKLTDERQRIDEMMKNNGYFSFSRQYVEFEVDTAYGEPQHVAIRTKINKPLNRDRHRQFRVDSVNFITNRNQGVIPMNTTTPEEYKNINYIFVKNRYNTKVLNRRIFIAQNELYNRSNTFRTQRQLANLDIFRFININYDSTGGKLVANIYTSPLKLYQLTSEIGMNVTQGFPGPFVNLSLKKRNVFGGLEIFEISGRIGYEGVLPATQVQDVYTSVEGGINASLTFPQFIMPVSAEVKERMGKVNPKTRLTVGYSYTDRPEYIRKNTNFAAVYTWQSEKNTFYQFTLTDASIIRSTLTDSFEELLDSLRTEGNNLINTFNPSFVSSMILSATWNKNSYGLNYVNSSFYRLFVESGGTTLNFVNTNFLERENLEFYQWIKANFDYRNNKPLNKNTTIAFRFNIGFAKSYGQNNDILPYEKYFFAGGSNGIRAWRPRRLGPGSFVRIDSTITNSEGLITPEVDYSFEQPGTILMEGSVEFRKNLIGFIDYAFFFDFGNIWNFKDTRDDAVFKLNRFYRQIAVGSGVGLRFDFSFLVLRLDAGIKVFDPARAPGKRFILSRGFYDAPFTRSASETVIFNIGIGYPF
ncbi:BamA/TamA family outer membrane protein [Fulvivirga sedimenti]|uniref:BamA/TamA family outer membrane protein n=1 Tax=Fulvivirga sedimenti TaxID=2879465 RepID=A0A9X1HUH2_9BACT|nr:BamA/TamA family outer membrane protein [Fulvivirga sedimenti]MCA6074953.1 BamA/TamA family outer membrane protein [Fulvivirga sedimenti]MCA6076130.1 BamA/TamA family outer membrane protein [Fulvivirga sedimenti]MCA6077258.1 BamA/TamA family outer membrane protein [Fulvivirga sedimenti]